MLPGKGEKRGSGASSRLVQDRTFLSLLPARFNRPQNIACSRCIGLCVCGVMLLRCFLPPFVWVLWRVVLLWQLHWPFLLVSLVMSISELFGSSVIYSSELVSLLTLFRVGKCSWLSKGSILFSPWCFSSRCQILANTHPFLLPRLSPVFVL